jgi:hypothetical protein
MTAPSSDDLIHLEQNYLAARDSLGDITWTEEFPHYPEPVVHLMCYILGSVWTHRGYDIDKATFVPPDEPTSLEEVRSTLTALARSEQLAAGSWKQSLEADRMRPLIKRARRIILPKASQEFIVH